MDLLERSYVYGRSPLPLQLSATRYNVYLFGGSISKSLSPLLHSILFRTNSVSWKFHLTETTDSTIFRNRLDESSCIGSAVTMPNKVTFSSHLDDLTEEARVIGAVNTTFVRLDEGGERKYIGTNTDCIGIRDSILHQMPRATMMAMGRPSMVIGAGGAARSAIFALWKWFGSTEIYIVNRVASEVDALITFFKSTAPDIQLRHLATVKAAAALETPYLVVGTIPDYLPREAGEIVCRQICTAILHRGEKGILLDMCYLPSPVTWLYTNAIKSGWAAVLGTEALVRVCIAQQALWLERSVNERGLEEALSAIQKIVSRGQNDRMASKM